MTTMMYLFSLLTVLSAVGVVTARQPLHSALFLVLTLFLVAVHFALLGAHFVAATQVLVYAGAIMVLVIFVIMLLGVDAAVPEAPTRFSSVVAAIATGVMVVALGYVAMSGSELLPTDAGAVATVVDGSTKAVGQTLYTQYLYPFEVASVLILAGIVGAVMLGYEKKRPLKPGRGLQSKQEG